jgi:hypothetical protein
VKSTIVIPPFLVLTFWTAPDKAIHLPTYGAFKALA